jgi:hypothetical protein
MLVSAKLHGDVGHGWDFVNMALNY